MDLGLKGKAAVVAAASKGLGKAVAFGLAAEGVDVAICSRDREAIERAGEEIRAKTGVKVLAFQADLTDANAIHNFVQRAGEQFGRIDILFANSGGPPPGSFDSVDDAAWERAFSLNHLSAVRLTREVLPYLRRQGGGCIVYSTSISIKQPIENLILSNSIRSAVVLMAKTLMQEVARENIRVNVVCPGRIYTERIEQLDGARAQQAGLSVAEVARQSEAAIPLGRSGRPEEFADTVVYLCSNRASYLTGNVIQIDGGQYRGIF